MRNRYWSAIALFFALVTMIMSAHTSYAHSYWLIDQQQTSSVNAFPVDYWAQTFRTGARVDNILGFDLDFYNANGSSFYFQIRTVAGYSIVTTTGYMPMNNGLQHIDLPAEVPLTPNTDYELRVFDSTPNFSGDYAVRGLAGANAYTRGTARFPGGGNDTFGHDWFFRTYFVPEPISAILMATSLAGLFGLSHRRGR